MRDRAAPSHGEDSSAGRLPNSPAPSSPASRNAPPVMALCLSVATLLHARQIGQWSSPENRFYSHWQRADAWMLIASVVAVALLLYLIVIIVRRASWGRMLLRWL